MGLVLSFFVDVNSKEQAIKELGKLSKEELLSKLEVTSSYFSNPNTEQDSNEIAKSEHETYYNNK